MVSQHLDMVAWHAKAVLKQTAGNKGSRIVAASHTLLGERYLYCEGDVPLLFTENETNNERIFGTANAGPYVKDGINNYVVNGKQDAVNPQNTGTKAAAHYQINVGAGKTATIRLRLSDLAPAAMGDPFNGFAEIDAGSPARGRRVLSRHYAETGQQR